MRKLTLPLFLLSILFSTANYCIAQIDIKTPDLNGWWQFNSGEGKVSGGVVIPEPSPIVAQIVQSGPEIKFNLYKKLLTGQWVQTSASTYYIDGRGETNHFQTTDPVSKTKWEGPKLIVFVTGATKDDEERQEWWLSKDKNKLYRKVNRTVQMAFSKDGKVISTKIEKQEILHVYDRVKETPVE